MKVIIEGTVVLEYECGSPRHTVDVTVEGDESQPATDVTARYEEAVRELRKKEDKHANT